MSARARLAATVLATGIAALLALAGAAGPARAQPGGAAATARAGGAAEAPLALAVTSVSPQYAQPHSVITVTGEVINHSLTAASGVSVRLLYGPAFGARDLLNEYASGSGVPAQAPYPGAATAVRGPVPANGTATWTIRVRAGDLPLTGFGVYPLAAEALGASGAVLATSRSYLPYWPSRRSASRMPVSWLWPLIDTPDQAVCPGLLTGRLAASLASGGRLAGLLAAGENDGRQAALTWAVDPALLAAAQTMTSRYQVGAGPHCNRGRSEPASQAAAAWLAGLRTATAGQPVMATPYADIDVAALTRQGMNADIATAFRLGRAEAGAILHRSFSPGAAAASQQSLTGYAWPADGIANFQTLGVLAVNGISSVVLAAHTMPPQAAQGYTPSAVTTTPNGETGQTTVLLSDDTLTQILAGAGPGAGPPGAHFATAQLFLAETAMIAAERPNLARAIVVAPPRGWDPSAALAGQLLHETAVAPWLRPVSLNHLAAAAPDGRVARVRPNATSRDELAPALLRAVHALDHKVSLLQGIQVQPDPALAGAVAGTESSAWRGGRAATARGLALLGRITQTVTGQLARVYIIPALRDTLGASRGTVPVSIANQLPYPVRVRLAIQVPAGDSLTITNRPGVISVRAGQIVTVKLKVHAPLGTTVLSLRLLTAHGRPLPGASRTLTVEATQFGTVAVVIVAAALGVFMISSTARAIRRGRAQHAPPPAAGAEPGSGPGSGPGGGPSGTGQDSQDGLDAGAGRAGGPPGPPGPAPGADTVNSSEASARTGPRPAGEHAGTEDADDYAPAPGRPDRG